MSPEQKEKDNALKRKALYDIMTCMRDIRKRAERTDTMFEPLRNTVASLATFNISLNEVVLEQLENAEHKWKLLKKKMFTRKEQLTSLQQTEAIEIRRKSDAFGERVDAYRRFFQRTAPFGVAVSGRRRGGGGRVTLCGGSKTAPFGVAVSGRRRVCGGQGDAVQWLVGADLTCLPPPSPPPGWRDQAGPGEARLQGAQ